MAWQTLGELRAAGSPLKIECLRCGKIEKRDVAQIAGADSLSIGEVGLSLTCSACGAKACIATPVPEGGKS